MSYGVDRRRSSDPALLWLWCRPVATALTKPLAWEPPYAASAALKRQKKKTPPPKKKKNPAGWMGCLLAIQNESFIFWKKVFWS